MRIRTALITAAARGIGRATAQRLADEGVRVGIVDRDEAGLKETAAMIRTAGGLVEIWTADCTDARAISAAARAAVERLGTVDALVNNMGGSARGDGAPFLEQDPVIFARIIHQCLMSAMLWSQAVIGDMRERGYGKVINIASDAAFAGDAQIAEYAAAKAGVVGLTRSLAQEFAPYGIAVNAVAPGPTRTAALEAMSSAVLSAATARIPMQRLGDPGDIAGAVAFFASGDADFVTGQTLIVDGGRWMN